MKTPGFMINAKYLITKQSICTCIRPFCFIFAFNVLIINGLYGQGLEKLDKKQGYKNIQIGDSIHKHTFFFEYDGRANDGYDVYSLILQEGLVYQIPADSLTKVPKDTILPNPYLNIGHIPLRRMHLLVYKEKIYEILLTFEGLYFQDVKEILISAYGEPNILLCDEIESDGVKKIDCLWRGKVMGLWCRFVDFGEEQQKTLVGFKNYKAVDKIKKEMQKQAVKEILGEN